MAARKKLPPIQPGVHKYNVVFPAGTHDLTIELWAFRNNWSVSQGGLGKYRHFWNIISILWPKEGRVTIEENPWSERAIRAACDHDYLGVTGPGGCGKSMLFAVWALVNYYCAPLDTAVVVTSTTLKGSRQRAWGYICDFHRNTSIPMPGKLVDSLGTLRYENADTGEKGSDRCGITIIAGEKKKEKENVQNLIGIHNERVLMIADELPDLSPAILNAATGNLSRNPHFQLIGLGNAKSVLDPHGILCTPKNGWKSVTVEDDEWETELGYAIHFDSSRSPNISEGKTVWPYLPTQEDIDDSIEKNGENSLAYWRMTRGWWAPEGATKGIYSESEIVSYEADRKNVNWLTEPTPCVGLDLSFTNGGDETIAVFGKFGDSVEGYKVLLVDALVQITEDTTVKKPRHFQIAEKFIAECKKRKVEPQHVGYDCSGGGTLFGDILAELWSPECYGVQFGGAPSDMLVGNVGALPAKERYFDRVSELWFVGKDFIRSMQIKGILPDIARDMVVRNGTTVKRGDRVVEKVEPKKDVRARTGRSPDRAEGLFILLDLCRYRFKFRANTAKVVSKVQRAKWGKFVMKTEAPLRDAGRVLRTSTMLRGSGWGVDGLW